MANNQTPQGETPHTLGAPKVATDPASQIQQVTANLDGLKDVIAAWGETVKGFVATGSDDDDVIVTHDAKGRLIELWVQPGVQQDMTVDEFEDAINDAIEDNRSRATKEFSKMADEFLAQFARAPYTAMAQHPVADQLSNALSRSTRKKR